MPRLAKQQDEEFMALALMEAAKGKGRTSPNPPVGAVVVKNGKLVAKAHHRKAGRAHAEVSALKQAGSRARGATLYVSLAPCNHHGKTPPCVELLKQAKLARVVVGMKDPNPAVKGDGIPALRAAKIAVTVGVLKSECERFYRPYTTFVVKKRPFVIVKAAMSLDGMVATASGESQWLTETVARQHGHALRDQVDAILVGRGTIMSDNPRLTARLSGRKKGKDPVRVVLDSRLRIPPRAKVIKVRSIAPTWVMAAKNASGMRERVLSEEGAQVIRCTSSMTGQIELKAMLKTLAKRDIMTLLVEGGPSIFTSFFGAGLVDQVQLYLALKLLGGKGLPLCAGLRINSLKEALSLQNVAIRDIGNDLLVTGDL